MLSRLASLSAMVVICACGGGSEPAPVEPVPAPGPAAASDEAPAVAQPVAAESPDEAALLAAADDYTRKHAAAGLEFTLKIQAQEGDFALLVIEPRKKNADAALLFMKREAGGWKGLDLGTGIDCSDLADQGVPASLCSSLR